MDLGNPETVNKPPYIPRNANIPGSNWVTVTKKKGYPVVLPVEALGDASLDDKKSAAYQFLLSINRKFTSFQAKKINGVDVIGASFYSDEDAFLACANPLSADTPNAQFTPLADFNNLLFLHRLKYLPEKILVDREKLQSSRKLSPARIPREYLSDKGVKSDASLAGLTFKN